MYNLKAQSLVFKGYRKGKEGKVPADNKLYKYEEIEKCDFRDAVKMLAEREHLDLSQYQKSNYSNAKNESY